MKTAALGLGIAGFSTQSADAAPAGRPTFAEAGYEHEVHFSSLPSDTYRPREDLLKAALSDAGLDRADFEGMSTVEREEALSFPGDRERLVDPSISGVNIDTPPSVTLNSGQLRLPSNEGDITDAAAATDVLVKQASEGIAARGNPVQNVVVTDLVDAAEPSRGYSLAPDATYRTPNFDVESTTRDGGIDIRSGNTTRHVGSNQTETIEHATASAALRLRTYDGALRTVSVDVTPRLKIANHGRVSVRGDDR